MFWEAPQDAAANRPAQTRTNRALWCVRVETGVFANTQVKQNERWKVMPLVLAHGLRFDKRTKTWKPLILLTNLAVRPGEQIGPYTYFELGALYGERWAIEVFFKFVKQHLNFSHLTSRCENGIRVMLYMSLIASLLLLWYQRQTKIDRGWRSVKSWFAFDLRQWLTDAFRETFALLAEKHLITINVQRE